MSSPIPLHPEQVVAQAARAARTGEPALARVLEEIPAAIYVTDCEGTVTHFNRACRELAGRQPEPRRDRWCVTWKLYTADGAFLPHDRCPMAVAIREKRRVRGVSAIAERPDGSRVRFIPFPTPVLDDDGTMTAAVNLLVDLADPRYLEFLRDQAARCRRLAAGIDDQASATLLGMAAEYEQQVREVERPN